ncbi:MAG: hypothetical protein RBG1_1C00001G0358 [candidate division Zixibacteria bacterium RBG-1]|nr:MAG: hypothetical protein RBG1_1C00001G0358 [candidate division Zixibacteria bacterium RBG-1]OGC84374.1 MAG: hypothetical protein A2V73_09350 [candidate division Zixibacteria bacterium RBG_19FT_COMBO_42_43]
MLNLNNFIALSFILFLIGVFGLFTQKNKYSVLGAVVFLLNGLSLLWVSFSRVVVPYSHLGYLALGIIWLVFLLLFSLGIFSPHAKSTKEEKSLSQEGEESLKQVKWNDFRKILKVNSKLLSELEDGKLQYHLFVIFFALLLILLAKLSR